MSANFLYVREMKKVSSVSRARKLEEVCGIGGAKLMKPRIELNPNGRLGLEWVLFCWQ
jgi:hypothetical protein